MPKIRMRDTTAHADYGQLLAGEVYDVSDEHHDHFVRSGLASKASADTQTYHEKRAEDSGLVPGGALAAEALEEEGAPMRPEIARQVEEAGTRPGDVATTPAPEPQPIVGTPPQGIQRGTARGR